MRGIFLAVLVLMLFGSRAGAETNPIVQGAGTTVYVTCDPESAYKSVGGLLRKEWSVTVQCKRGMMYTRTFLYDPDITPITSRVPRPQLTPNDVPALLLIIGAAAAILFCLFFVVPFIAQKVAPFIPSLGQPFRLIFGKLAHLISKRRYKPAPKFISELFDDPPSGR